MKHVRAVLSIALLLLVLPAAAQTSAAQTESFDIATFVTPAGWSRTDFNGALVLQDTKVLPDHVIFCQIYLFPSRPGNAAPALEFQNEWQARIAQTMGVLQHTQPQIEKNPDGWTGVSATAGFLRQGTPTQAVLVSGIGFGRVMSAVVLVSPNSYQAEVEEFFKRMDLHADRIQANTGTQAHTGPAVGSGNTPNLDSSGGLSRYVYTPPPGWARQNAQGAIILAPAQEIGERCQIQMLALRSASGSVTDEAIGTFRSTFKDDPLQTYPSPAQTLARGISPQGWEYFEIRKIVGGQEGDGRGFGAILLLVRLDDAVATVIGLSKDFMLSRCFGNLQANVWPAFFYGLSFKDAHPSSTARNGLRQQLAGTWILATATVGLAYTFQPDGRYASTDRARNLTSQTYFGNGSYSFEGNTLVLTDDDKRRTVAMFRLRQVSHSSGHNWEDELCMMEPGQGELCYRRGR